MEKTVGKIIKKITNELKGIYPDKEIKSFAEILLNHYAKMDKLQIFIYPDKELDDKILGKLDNALKLLKDEVPIQYIIGKTEFYGLPIFVSTDVLIPRPETEELLDLIIKNHKNETVNSILDVGTGSACIALTLKKYLPTAKISAMDVSEKALIIARKNADYNRLNISFIKEDILSPKKTNYPIYDIIVSNPPYVRESEKSLMQKNVLEYEPHIALFVKDNDALIFYSAIINFAKKNLKNNGYIYFEINEALAQSVALLLNENNFSGIEIYKDIFGKDRIIKAIKY